MESGIPVATDNIYKFYALFGLVVLVSCILGFFYLHKAQIELQAQIITELETLRANTSRTKQEDIRMGVLDQRQKVELKDYNYTLKWLGYFIGGALCAVGYGFFKWHYTIQPEQDRLTRLQIEKLTLEVRNLRRSSRR